MARRWDAHGFSDLSRSVEYLTALTYLYKPNDPRKFEKGTPKQVCKTQTRCWEMAPSSERIIDDVIAPHVLRNMVKAEGCVVADNDIRSGKRYVLVHNRKELKI